MPKALANTGGLPLSRMLKNTPQSIIDKKDTVTVSRHAIQAKTPDMGRTVIIVLGTVTQDSSHEYEQEIRYFGRGKYWVSCDCANFRYVWEYALAQHGASEVIFGNGAAPVERNPALITGICKHLYHILAKAGVADRLQKEWQKSNGLLRRAR